MKRAASEFALVVMAGELAIEYGIVPWPKGDAIKAAVEMFDAKTAYRRPGIEGREIFEITSVSVSRLPPVSKILQRCSGISQLAPLCHSAAVASIACRRA